MQIFAFQDNFRLYAPFVGHNYILNFVVFVYALFRQKGLYGVVRMFGNVNELVKFSTFYTFDDLCSFELLV